MTSSTSQQSLTLDPALLDRLAEVICGNDRAYYRKQWEIPRLFERAGWTWTGDDVEPSRLSWTKEVLRDRRVTPERLAALACRLASPIEYLDDDDAHREAVEDLQELLSHQGLAIDLSGQTPTLCSASDLPEADAIGGYGTLELDVALNDIVDDEQFGAQLEQRLREARICWDKGADLAATIMLGSLIEGVLYDRAVSTGTGKSDNLAGLIELAVKEGWINPDIGQYADVLRDHRNLIHPRKQHRDGHSPDTDSVRIAWNVAIATLNSLARLDRD